MTAIPVYEVRVENLVEDGIEFLFINNPTKEEILKTIEDFREAIKQCADDDEFPTDKDCDHFIEYINDKNKKKESLSFKRPLYFNQR